MMPRHVLYSGVLVTDLRRAGCLPAADLKPRTLGSTCPPPPCSSPTRSSEGALQITAQKQAGWEEEKGLEKIDS